MQFNYNTCQDFIKDVFNYFKTNNIKINQDDINMIKRAQPFLIKYFIVL